MAIPVREDRERNPQRWPFRRCRRWATARVVTINGASGIYRTDIWVTGSAPVDNADPADPALTWPADRFLPMPGGTFCFIIEVPTDEPGAARHLHATGTLDCVGVLRGEILALHEGEETLMKAEDFCI